jgi:hypothetical protein
MQKTQVDNRQENSGNRTIHKTNLTRTITWIFLGIGTITLIVSVTLSSSTLAFIGLGLVFWGAILAYIQPEQYTKKVILDSTVIPLFETLNKIIQELNYKGKGIYLPPKYLKDPQSSKIYISKQKNGKLPEPELILKHENQLFLENPQGILLTPPGAQLSNLFEKRLDTNFVKIGLEYIKQNLPRLIIDDLDLAENIEIETENNQIKIRITNSIFKEKIPNKYLSIGCPLSDTVACALTKATGKPLIIEKINTSEDGNIIEATYQTIGKTEKPSSEILLPKTKTEEALLKTLPIQMKNYFISNLASLLLTAIGSIFLAQVAWIIFYDVTIWGKDIVEIFLDPRTGEAISLGMGMQLIHYFLIGLASFLLGIFLYLRNRRRI